MTNSIRATHILWTTFDRNHWQIITTGSYKECEQEKDRLGDEGYEIHPNEIKDSWNDAVQRIHYDTYMDNTTESRPMSDEELKAEA